MQLKEFTERYDLHLLTTSHQGVQLGDLVWKRHWRSNRLQYRGMGSNVFNRLYDAELLSKTELKKRLEEIKEPPPVNWLLWHICICEMWTASVEYSSNSCSRKLP